MTRRMETIGDAASAARAELSGLVARIASGDRGALADLYRRTSAKLYGIIARIVPAEPDAAEVLQDVYLSVWNNAGRFDPGRASPISWLAVMARNRAIDRRRKRSLPTEPIEAAFALADDAPSPLAETEAAQDRHRLADCLGELEPAHAGYIRAAFLDGDSYSELATRDSVPLGTMKSWIRRALIRIRECLER